MRRIAALFGLLLPLAAAAELTAWPSQLPPPAGAVLLDTRPAADCAARSVRGARCLPAQEFRDAQEHLPAWRDILWLFSTARLTGSETVLVLGEQAADRDQVAALLYIAGQHHVRVVETPVSRLLDKGAAAGPGVPRDFARQVAYTVRMRDGLLILRQELDPRRQRLIDAARPPVRPGTSDGRVPVLTSASPGPSLAAFTRWWLAGRHDVRVVPEPMASAAWQKGLAS